ncbi:MAG: acetyl-CoA carboxylase, carboxyltransferase subunit beta [Pseudomonadota bacterium]|uniref:acetyl-CoA carboxylase, carboxyltransferase subunit beta n=1 Tax=unclassified Phenylobacterium TaxID=2640670 RepID=UPI0006FF4376|nr:MULTISPECIES: acetyl-CoA carboxylase, carboxyltransferase subunit beta [unclassified Phenylobacterium]KRB51108.1 acetyl-CoA carboxylase carboxyl transferase subunit beta [Phenylobacterium sp. Root700]MBT9471566.1 acetyl-CoA carboxylase carboxyltransferase subunit beta [Phenylobacterium sp.]
MAMAEQRNDKTGKGPQGPKERRGWLSRIAPGVRNLVTKRETPENLWVKCPDTGEMIYRSDLEAALWVTPSGSHMRIGAEQRLRYTFDDGQYEKLPFPTGVVDDPLKFPDDRSYGDRLKAARKATGAQDSMTSGYGKIQDLPVVVTVQDFSFMGGSLGMGAGEAFIKAAQEAVKRNCPYVIFTASGGARMQEGTLSLMQMARTTLALNEVKAAGLPYIVVLTDPTSGGVAASYAMLGDIHLAEPNAMVAFAGRRVIEQTIREVLPPGFQRAEFLVERGQIDRVVQRSEMRDVLGSILKTLMMGRDRSKAA